MTNTYGDVDRSADPRKAVEWQDYVDSWPQIKAYKRRVLELFEGVEGVVDIGCGPGADVLAIGADRCIGIDRSIVMCATADSRGARTVQADVRHLPFGNGVLGGVYADRVLQHVEDPMSAVEEMVRVLCPGG